jgi:predicted enzyme involved in methoxymalonyl-ACP biosynthesis
MELAMLDALAETCKQKGIAEIYGYYFPTSKNAMVKDLFKTLGFDKTGENSAGTVWKLDTSTYQKQNKHITVRR